LLVLLGIALGRDAISIRLVAVGALIVLPFRPEALAGPGSHGARLVVIDLVPPGVTNMKMR
jgi:competence protein ComEC